MNVYGLKEGEKVMVVNSVEADSNDIVLEIESIKKAIGTSGGCVKVENISRISEGNLCYYTTDTILFNCFFITVY